MRYRSQICRALLIICCVALSSSVFAQSKEQKKRKLKDFGSSLKRLKWNPIQKETVETKPATQSTTDEDDVIRVDTSLVSLDVLVVDKHGNPVRGLTAADFAISEEGFPQQVGHFLLGDNQTVPRTIVLIIDYSGSQLPFLRSSIDAAKVLVDQLAPLDKMAIVTDDVELILDFTDDKKKLKSKLESLFDRTKRGGFFSMNEQRVGKSKQYSALLATLNESFTDEDKRPIIVFQTDGDEVYRLQDPVIKPAIPPGVPAELRAGWEEHVQFRTAFMFENRTEFSLADVYRAAEKSRATIYTIVPGYQLLGRSPENQVDLTRLDTERRFDDQWSRFSAREREMMKAQARAPWEALSDEVMKFKARESYIVQLALAGVAARTGGWTDFLERPEQASSIYSRIFSDINQRYIVGYYPTNKERDGKRRKISIEVKGHPDYTILGRKSYYAPSGG